MQKANQPLTNDELIKMIAIQDAMDDPELFQELVFEASRQNHRG